MRAILASFGIAWIVAVLLAFAGWVLNIMKLVGLVGGEFTTEFAVRGIGIFFAPLGAVYGWF